MQSNARLILSMLSRGALLVFACLALVGAAYMGLSAAAPSPNDKDASFDVSDSLGLPGKDVWFMHTSTPLEPSPGDNLLAVTIQGQPCMKVQPDDGMLVVGLEANSPGLHHAWVDGWPYGRLTYRRLDRCLLIVPHDQKVFVIDANLAQSLFDRPAVLRELIAAMTGQGAIVFVHPGPAADSNAFRRRLRDMGIEAPVVTFFARPGVPGCLDYVQSTLATAKRDPKTGQAWAPAAFVTDDEKMVTAAEIRHFVAHLIGQASGGFAKEHSAAHGHDSPRDFVRYLSGRL